MPVLPIIYLLVVAGSPSPEASASSLLLEAQFQLGISTSVNTPKTDLSINDLGFWETEGLLEPSDSSRYLFAIAAIALEAELADHIYVRTLLDSGELRPGRSLDPPIDGVTSNMQSIGEEAKSTGFIRELSVAWGSPWLYGSFGKQPAEVLGGLVYADYGLGASLIIDLNEEQILPLRFELLLQCVGRTLEEYTNPSPLAAARLSWEYSYFENIGIEIAAFWDHNDSLHDIMFSTAAEAPIAYTDDRAELQERITDYFWHEQLSGRLLYLGVSGQMIPADGLSIRYAGAYSTGTTTIGRPELTEPPPNGAPPQPPPKPITFALSGWGLDVNVNYGLSPDLGIGLLGFALSGDRAPKVNRTVDMEWPYNAFIGAAPYWVWSGLFFSGGLNQGYAPSRATAGGVNGHGVMGAGPEIRWGDSYNYLEARALWLEAFTPNAVQRYQSDKTTYGIEVDLLGEWDLWQEDHVGLSVGGEFDVLFPGDFFPTSKVAFRAIGMLNVRLAN